MLKIQVYYFFIIKIMNHFIVKNVSNFIDMNVLMHLPIILPIFIILIGTVNVAIVTDNVVGTQKYGIGKISPILWLEYLRP